MCIRDRSKEDWIIDEWFFKWTFKLSTKFIFEKNFKGISDNVNISFYEKEMKSTFNSLNIAYQLVFAPPKLIAC